MSTGAQDEFDTLMRTARETSSKHPEDRVLTSDTSSAHSKDGYGSGSRSRSGSPKRARGIRSGGRNSRITGNNNDDDDDLEAVQRAANERMRGAGYYLPSKQREANTGPKGVIADAYAFEDAKRAAAVQSRSGNVASPPPPARASGPFGGSKSRKKNEEDGSSGNDEDDAGFLKRWRKKRLRDLESRAHGGSGSNGTGDSAGSSKRWGKLVTVDAEGYLDAVEKSPPGTTVVVLIYDDASEVSAIIDSLVRDVAFSFPSTRFIRLHCDEAEFEPAGVPAILAYRNGDKFAGLVPVVDELPEDADVSAETLAEVLKRHQIL